MIDTSKLQFKWDGDDNEGVAQLVGDWTIVDDRKVSIKIRGLKTGSKGFTISYNNGTAVNGTITVAKMETGNLLLDTLGARNGDRLKIRQQFSIAPNLDDVTFEFPENLVEIPGTKALEGTDVVIEANHTTGTAVVKSYYKGKYLNQFPIILSDRSVSLPEPETEVLEGEEGDLEVTLR